VNLRSRLRSLLRRGGNDPSEVVSRHWSREAGTWRTGRGRQWTELSLVARAINRRISGREEVDAYQYVLETHLQGRLPLERVLTLGCGGGELERGLTKYGLAREYVGLDIADGALERARAAAREAGLEAIRYERADLDRLELPPKTYDIVFGVFSVHHVRELERLMDQVARTLRPGGLFVLNEYVGPTRFQWPREQVDLCNALLATLPERARRIVTSPLRVKRTIWCPTVEELAAIDPSEAVRSAEIEPVLSRRFDVIDRRPYGGTILHPLLADIAGNFESDDPAVVAILDALIRTEENLMESGLIPSDFMLLIAHPRTA